METFSLSALIEAMTFDKKKKDDVITFILLKSIGESFIHKKAIPDAVIETVWRAGGAR
jgi:3-dehydroquinate synthetase